MLENKATNRLLIMYHYMKSLETEIAGLRLANPLWIAHELRIGSGRILKKIALEGKPGAIVANPSYKPNIYSDSSSHKRRYGQGVVSPEKGDAIALLKALLIQEMPKALKGGIPVFIVVHPGFLSLDNLAEAATIIEASGASGIELRLDSQTHGLTLLINTNGSVAKVIKEIKETITIPLFIRIPYLYPTTLEMNIGPLVKAGVDGIVAGGNIVGSSVDVEAVMHSTAHPPRIGTLYGQPVKPISVALVQVVASKFGIPVIGTGGMRFGEDLVEFLMAGASAVEVPMENSFKKPAFFQNLNRGLYEWLLEKGYEGPSQLRGSVLGFVGIEDNEPHYALVDEEKCSACGRCVTICESITYKDSNEPFSAIIIPEGGHVAKVTEERCVGCGWCKVVCHRNAINLKGYASGSYP